MTVTHWSYSSVSTVARSERGRNHGDTTGDSYDSDCLNEKQSDNHAGNSPARSVPPVGVRCCPVIRVMRRRTHESHYLRVFDIQWFECASDGLNNH